VESDKDQRLLELIESGKSWVLIPALRKQGPSKVF
jgi:hypothetical protein